MPTIELLFVDGCPGHERLVPILRRLARESGAELTLRRVDTSGQADAERFLGSPSVRVNGEDVEPGAAERADYGLTCRLYEIDGGLSDVPAEPWIVAALGRAT